MNKKILIILTSIMLLMVVLSGCNETENDNGNLDEVEIIEWYEGTYWEAGRLMYNGLSYNENALLYMVNGTARNLANQVLNSVIIWVKYYDINNTLLWEDGILENGVGINETWEFRSIYISSREHFKDVDHVEFDISGKFSE
jgi:hypothetical protein